MIRAEQIEQVRQAAGRARGQGKWRRADCPECDGSRRDALSINVETGGFYCHRCGFKGKVGDVGIVGRRAAHAERCDVQDAERRLSAAMRLWSEAHMPRPGGHVRGYIAGRCLPTEPWPQDVREHGALRHPSGAYFPGMLALIRDARGRPRGVHRTYLDVLDPIKAPCDPPRCSLGPIKGGAVRLGPPAERIAIGEGIETTWSAVVLDPTLGSPWAALSTTGMRAIELPPEVREVSLVVDNDGAGIQAARRLAKRLGRQYGVRVVRLFKSNTPGWDANDELRARSETEGAA